MQKLIQLREIIFNLNAENVHKSAQAAMNLFPKRSYSYSFDLIVSKLIYSYIVSHVHEKEIYFFLSFLQVISREGSNDIIKVFTKFLLDQCSQESYFILNEMLYLKLIKPDVIKKTKNLFFSHYISESVIQESRYNPELSYFFDNYDELSKNYWLLHKKVIKKGVNPNEIAKIIRNDEIEKLQEISSKQKFNFNQTVNPSIYERCSFINKNNVSLIDYAAFFGSIQCFKYLLINGANVSNTGKYALVGGNIEIIHLCEQNHSSFRGAYETAIMFNKFDIFYYLYENNKEILKNLNEIGKICIKYNNYELLTFLEKEGMKTDESLINEAARNGDLFLVIYYHQNFKLPQNILGFASKSENIEIIKYILGTKESDVNAKFDFLE